MAATPSSAVVDRDVRVGDFLDDKLQTLADFESLDSLLQNVRERHSLLRQQVCTQFISFSGLS